MDANYVFGKPVIGTLTVNMTVDIGSYLVRRGLYFPKTIIKKVKVLFKNCYYKYCLAV